jgi:hypothetical protein
MDVEACNRRESNEPIIERMLRAGYATFAWDKPATGESTGKIDRSRLIEQRSQIVLDAIAVLKECPEIDAQQLGLWGISQAGYVMPTVLTRSDDIAFMIAVSCPGGPGVDQGAYLSDPLFPDGTRPQYGHQAGGGVAPA